MASKMVRRTTVRYVANDTCDTLERGGGQATLLCEGTAFGIRLF